MILSTRSGEEATRTSLRNTASSASGNIASASRYTSQSRSTEPFNPFQPFPTLRSLLSSLPSKATGQEPGKPVTDPFPLPTLRSALSSLESEATAQKSGDRATSLRQVLPTLRSVLSSLEPEATAKETDKTATNPVPTLPTILGAVSGSLKSKSFASDLPTSGNLGSTQSRALLASESTQKMPLALLPSLEALQDASARPQSLISQLSSLKSELKPTNTPLSDLNSIASAAKSLFSEIPAASTGREPFDPLQPFPAAKSLISETNPRSTMSSNLSSP